MLAPPNPALTTQAPLRTCAQSPGMCPPIQTSAAGEASISSGSSPVSVPSRRLIKRHVRQHDDDVRAAARIAGIWRAAASAAEVISNGANALFSTM